MIKNKQVASEVSMLLCECSEKLNNTILSVREECSEEEFKEYRMAAGFIMGHIYTDLLRKIYKEHPDLEPEELKMK